MNDEYKPTLEEIEFFRRNEYNAQADPLFFQWQRAKELEQPEAEGLKVAYFAKVAEIEERNPYPAE